MKKKDQKFIPGYTGFVPVIKSGNVLGLPYGQTTNNFFKGEYKHGVKDRELDVINKNDKYVTFNDINYKDINKYAHQQLKKFIRPASANVNIPGYSSKAHNLQLTVAK